MDESELRGVHVLVVEDTDDTRELLREALQYCGAFVTTAGSAKEAERLLEKLQPHVIVTDISMPDDGIALARRVTEITKARGLEIPVVAISGHDPEPATLKQAGFIEFIRKPLDPIALCERIRARLRPPG